MVTQAPTLFPVAPLHEFVCVQANGKDMREMTGPFNVSEAPDR